MDGKIAVVKNGDEVKNGDAAELASRYFECGTRGQSTGHRAAFFCQRLTMDATEL